MLKIRTKFLLDESYNNQLKVVRNYILVEINHSLNWSYIPAHPYSILIISC